MRLGASFELLPQAGSGLLVKRRQPFDHAVGLRNRQNLFDPRFIIAERRKSIFESHTVAESHIDILAYLAPSDKLFRPTQTRYH